MATIKVFSAGGVKELKCFDTLDEVDFLDPEEIYDTFDPAEELLDFESE